MLLSLVSESQVSIYHNSDAGQWSKAFRLNSDKK